MNERNLLPARTRIADKNNPSLQGIIEGIAYRRDGIGLSALPYILKWDNEILARELRGRFYFWGADDIIELV